MKSLLCSEQQQHGIERGSNAPKKAPEVTIGTLQGACMPNLHVAPVKPGDISLTIRAMVALKDVSENVAKLIIPLVRCEPNLATGKRKRINSHANAETELGCKRMKAEMHQRIIYCGNPEVKNGVYRCQEPLPEGFDQEKPCPWCKFKNDADTYTVDHMIDADKYYNNLFQSTDAGQRLCDYYPTAIDRLSNGRGFEPIDPDHDVYAKVRCTLSGLIARREFFKNPGKFRLDVTPKVGEPAFLNYSGLPLQDCKVIGESGDQYQVELPHPLPPLPQRLCVDKHQVEKIGGQVPLIVVAFEDASDVLQDLARCYSNNGRSQEMQGIAVEHRRRPEFCAVNYFSGGGIGHKNVHARSRHSEMDRRRLFKDGCLLKKFTIGDCTIHSCKMYRIEIFRVLDHIGYLKANGQNGVRNCHSMRLPFIGLEALNWDRAVFSYLNCPNLKPRSEESTIKMSIDIEKVRGTKSWSSEAQQMGIKFMKPEMAGCQLHGLEMDLSQNTWAHDEYCRMHSRGIVTHMVINFIVTCSTMLARRAQMGAYKAIRLPRGTQSLRPIQKLDSNGVPKYTKGMKLHQLRHLRMHRLTLLLMPFIESMEPKEKREVRTLTTESAILTHVPCVYTQGFIDLLKTWRLHTFLTEPLEDGYGVREVHQADSVGRSFVAQYEALALKYNQKFFLRCGVSWSVQCVWIEN